MALSIFVLAGFILFILTHICPFLVIAFGIASIAHISGYPGTVPWILVVCIIPDIILYCMRSRRPPPPLILDDFNRYNYANQGTRLQ